MNGFEAFDSRAWVVDQLFTRHIKTTVKTKSRRPRLTSSVRLMLPIVSAVAALHFAPAPAAAQAYVYAQSRSIYETTAIPDPDLIVGDPKTYWSKLMHEIKQRPRAEESSLPDPDPLF